MSGADSGRFIGCVAKFAPDSFKKIDSLTYRIKPKDDENAYLEKVRVQRGFLHTVFVRGGYRLHIVNAHLKSRMFHPRYNQTDMRRLEARLLKYYVNDIIQADPEANVIVAGDMNDVYSSSPMVTLRGADQRPDRRLYDLKPADSCGATWTHWWNMEDSYGRIDYVLVSPALLPEIDFSKTGIPHIPELWFYASDHRPVITVITAKDEKLWTDGQISALFEDGIHIRQR
jgi:endonuclease/exonuclease/phosphatase family metal-dependent hydrolase